jgi:DNA N-6-adenine-methyltransferase (Dam)
MTLAAAKARSIAPPSHTRGAHTTDSWITPKWLIDRIGPFDLDPCQCDPQPWPCAATGYTENGLLLPWHGLVWCNPPYGKAMKAWLNKLALHGNGIALVFARTETEAFFGHVWPYASALMFLQGRLTFAYPDGSLPRNGANSGGPSVLIGYGEEARRRLHANADLGAVIEIASAPGPTGQRRSQ